MSRSPLLIIAHEATRTGSVVVLLRLLEDLRSQLPLPLTLRLMAGGPLKGALRRSSEQEDNAVAPAAVLINSALAAEEAMTVPPAVPVVVWVHEQGEALNVLAPEAIKALRSRCDRVWAVSEATRCDLIELGIEGSRIAVVPPLVAPPRPIAPEEMQAARSRIGIEAGTQGIVIGCGEASWRKGADLFLDVVRQLAIQQPLRAVWIGRRPRAFGRVLDHDTALLGLHGQLEWVGEVDDPLPFLALASVLVMCSREDPQPLVPLEAAQVGTPTVGFDIGGLSELSEAGAAHAVPYPDTRALADSAGRYMDAGRSSDALVRSAIRRIEHRHSPATVTRTVLAELELLLNGALS